MATELWRQEFSTQDGPSLLDMMMSVFMRGGPVSGNTSYRWQRFQSLQNWQGAAVMFSLEGELISATRVDEQHNEEFKYEMRIRKGHMFGENMMTMRLVGVHNTQTRKGHAHIEDESPLEVTLLSGSTATITLNENVNTPVPSILAMLGLSDTAFIMAFTDHLASYGPILPVKCENCEFVIEHYVDLRKMYGLNLCPTCFPGAVAEEEEKYGQIKNMIDRTYFQRVLELLPQELIGNALYR